LFADDAAALGALTRDWPRDIVAVALARLAQAGTGDRLSGC
jgi:hypothetical protein